MGHPVASAFGGRGAPGCLPRQAALGPAMTGALPLPSDQPVAVNALRNKRSALMGELAMHQQECDRIRSEIIHLDVVLSLFDPATDPGALPALRKRVHRTEWFAR